MIAALERGDKSTRVEAFVDAAFAFALTLWVIAGDSIPASVGIGSSVPKRRSRARCWGVLAATVPFASWVRRFSS